MKKITIFTLLAVLASVTPIPAEEIAQNVEIQELIDQPTAGSLEQGEYFFDTRIFPYGGAQASLRAGIFSRFTIGVSYGGLNIIGRGKPQWNDLPGVLVKYRVFEETDLPALCVGFDSQGYGLYLEDAERYEIKAKGLFAAISKNYLMRPLGTFGIHAGVNYNSIENDDDPNINGFVGIDKSINNQISLICEYNLALDDNSDQSLGRNRGYLNAGLRWIFAEQLGIEFNLKDILENQKNTAYIARELRITYVESF